MLSFDDSLIVFVSIFYECRERRVFAFIGEYVEALLLGGYI